jgi:hypothetical protein
LKNRKWRCSVRFYPATKKTTTSGSGSIHNHRGAS